MNQILPFLSFFSLKIVISFLGASLFIACSFDYGDQTGNDDSKPDIIMNKVQYVRMENGNPSVRFTAETVERYEKRHTMELETFSFEQFDKQDGSISLTGNAGTATVELDSGDVQMGKGISIDVQSEEATISTNSVAWKDKERFLSSGANETVRIQKHDGTNVTGKGFSARVRDRVWSFTDGVQGIYNQNDD